MSQVFKRYPVGGGEMLLALALADVARDDGVLMLNDSASELARKTRQTDQGVRNQLRRMQAMGWLVKVRGSDGGRGKVAVYRISQEWISGANLAPAAAAEEVPEQPAPRPDPDPASGPETPNAVGSFGPVNPQPRLGFQADETPNAVGSNPQPRWGAYITRNTKYINTPPTPQSGGAGSAEASPDPKEPLITLKTAISMAKAAGQKAIQADDPVFAYAERVGIPRELIELQWREFKLRRGGDTGKRQRGLLGWRQAFRNSVRDNLFRLWFIRSGQPASLTTQGVQAQADWDAERAEQAAQDELPMGDEGGAHGQHG